MFRLNFGVRNYRCRNCKALCSMNPYIFLRWSLIPWAFVLLSTMTIMFWGLWPFLVLFVVIRTAWVFASPHIVPMQVRLPQKEVT